MTPASSRTAIRVPFAGSGIFCEDLIGARGHSNDAARRRLSECLHELFERRHVDPYGRSLARSRRSRRSARKTQREEDPESDARRVCAMCHVPSPQSGPPLAEQHSSAIMPIRRSCSGAGLNSFDRGEG
jgi:hypothetical protein